MDDWIASGLLAGPHKHGLGRGRGSKALWSAEQANLFLRLLRARQGARRVKTLCNLPVWLWLTEGDDYVPLSQARRALATWATGSTWTAQRHARRAVRMTLDQLGREELPPTTRRQLEILLVDALVTSKLDEVRLAQLGERQGSAKVEGLVRMMRARYMALRNLPRVDDGLYLRARDLYRSFRPAMHLGDPKLEETANRACLDLCTILGVLLSEGEPPSNE